MPETDLDVMDISSISAEPTEPIDTTSTDVVDPASDDSTTGQADIQDGTPGVQTVPYDRFNEVTTENKQLRDQINKILELQLGTRPQQQLQPTQEFKPKSDAEIISEVVGDDGFLTPDHMIEIMRRKDEQSNRIASVQSQNHREESLIQHETVFRQTNPDYDQVIANIPQHIARALMQSIDNPAVLVAEAYKLSKAYVPQQTSAGQVARQAQGKPTTAPRPITANQIKGGGTGTKTAKEIADELWKQI